MTFIKWKLSLQIFIFAFLILSQSVYAYQRNIWDVLRLQFKLNHQVSQAEVRKQIQWLAARPHYVRKLAQQSEPYIYHILSEIKKRHLPGELALIPMIESDYDPFAYSRAGAAGLWQLMPGTGSGLGLKQDWWFDGRRHIQQSTDAALSYYEYLNNYFHGDWILSLAAYDSGEGTVAKAIRQRKQNNNRVNFWSLNLPRETKAYIPKLLALAEIIKYAPQYHVHLPDIPFKPSFETVNVGSQIDLVQAARYAEISYKDLIRLNPGYNRWATPPYAPYHLNLPIEKAELFKQKILNLHKDELVNWKKHAVAKNENLSVIAHQHRTRVALIKELNHLKSNKVRDGQILLIPQINHFPKHLATTIQKKQIVDRSTTSLHNKIVHIVQAGDDFNIVKNRYGVSPEEVRYWNQIKSLRKLIPGEQLVIWKKAIPSKGYKVKKGDSLTRLAKRFHTTVAQIKRANPSLKGNMIQIGQRLTIA